MLGRAILLGPDISTLVQHTRAFCVQTRERFAAPEVKLAESYKILGDLCLSLIDPSRKARAFYENAMKLREQLASEDPLDLQAVESLTISGAG